MREHALRFPTATHLHEGARVLVILAHPRVDRSQVNRTLFESIADLPGVSTHDLYEAYATHWIDVAFEQSLVDAHDVIVLQHPFFWYSMPSLLKEWIDAVFTWGWAYGEGGKALAGKQLLTAITTGGSESAYGHGGHNRFTIRELLAPVAQTAHLCGMTYLPPFATHGTHQLDADSLSKAVLEYRTVLTALVEDRVPLHKLADAPRINHDLQWAASPQG